MLLRDLEKKLDSYKSGTFVSAEWARNIESAKAKKLGYQVVKHSKGLIRTEINYSNLEKVLNQSNIVSEDKKESWFEHYNKGILQSKKNPEKKYLQAFPIPGRKIKAEYLLNGKPVNPSELYEQGLITKASLPNSDDGEELLTFSVSIDNLISFGG